VYGKQSVNPELIDRIYESSVVPELWPDVLEELGKIAEGTGARLSSSAKPIFSIGPLRLTTAKQPKHSSTADGFPEDRSLLVYLVRAMPVF
jgi:hypothetical protein